MLKNKTTLSINPTYLCNFRCDFCYLTPEQLADKQKLDLNRLGDMLDDCIKYGAEVNHVDLYGGEVGLLSEDYLNEIHRMVTERFDATFNVVTNLYKIHPYFLREDVELSVSYDFEARERHEAVLLNMISIPKPIHILMLASPALIKMDVERMISTFNSIRNVESVEIKPYSSNQANQLPVSDEEYEDFVWRWIESSTEKDFEFTNEESLINVVRGDANAFSDDHIYITPNGKFAALEFDENDNEFFEEYNSYVGYIKWSIKEKYKVHGNKFCGSCEYLGKCLTEHYRDVKALDPTCNGYKRLIDRYRDRIHN